jgi:hypothetical protein
VGRSTPSSRKARRLRSDFLRGLERALIAEAWEDIGVALRVAVLLSLEFTHAQTRNYLDLTTSEMRHAQQLVRRGAERLRDDDANPAPDPTQRARRPGGPPRT